MNPLLSGQYAFRSSMVDRLAADLMGPDSIDEVLDELPLDRYIVGVLWPKDGTTQEDVAEEPESGEPDVESGVDTPVSQSRLKYPSSMGITLSVDREVAASLTVACSAARYMPETASQVDEPVERNRSRKARELRTWAREPFEQNDLRIDLDSVGSSRHEVAPGLDLYVLVRAPQGTTVTVTLALENRLAATAGARDANAWFQPSVVATTEEPAIVDRNRFGRIGSDEDINTSALLYRNNRTFAVGHGCAATWEVEDASSAVARVATTFIPTTDLRRAKAAGVPGSDLRMSFLAEADDASVFAGLDKLVSEYRGWIAKQREFVAGGSSDVPSDLRAVATRHMGDAELAAKRIAAGIALLRTDDTAMRAFRLMNTAMQLQRARQVWIRAGAKGECGAGSDAEWRPFQLAFVLLNLPGVSDPAHPDRDIADLLWFPTGGGKTEAYLGLIGYTAVYRRLANAGVSGVAAIMRYTLRLLTIQQFERASMLICALEALRRDNLDLGPNLFSIGLWVGQAATPNSLDDAAAALRKINRGHEVTEGNPVQVVRCPWCGVSLDAGNYRVTAPPDRHMTIACGSNVCDFKDGLPIHLVDEEVYEARPDLIIGTVDKFAQMAWRDVGSLFGRDGAGLMPDLIVQDELHLISGPLGSMVGLYETAVDAACSVDPMQPFDPAARRPKVVASTATIRRAREQVKAVFNRNAAQFPPPGLEPDVNFFAVPADAGDLGTREYVGLMAPGTSHQTLMIRVYASLLQSAADLPGTDAERDPYWTLIGYFNSLRILGSAYLQVQDDVNTRLDVLAGRYGNPKRQIREPNELTSRVSSKEIPERLTRLETKYGESGAEDVVLATNMISVGVDVDRLGLMAVMGQPQSSAEYIQATSRVGRQYPGLVVTILNSARSRDRSHYENFVPFHQAIYRSVEATSATPFAARARDRGLHGALVSTARLLFSDLAAANAAHLVDGQEEKLDRVVEVIRSRVRDVAPREYDATVEQTSALAEVWGDAARSRPNLPYRNKNNPEAALLIAPADAIVHPDIAYDTSETPWPTLQSLRDVDAESALYQVPPKAGRK